MKLFCSGVVTLIYVVHQISAQTPGGVSTNLKSWYKANGNIITGNSTVSSWNNEVAGSVNLTSVKGLPSYNSSGFNFNPTVHFGGNEVIYTSATTLGSNFFSANANSSFIVFTSALPSATSAVMAKWEDNTASNTNRISWEIATTGKLRFDFPSSGIGTTFSTTTIASMSYIGSGITNNNIDSLSVNGTLETVNAITTNTSNISRSGIFQLGANYATLAYPFSGNLAEVIYFNSNLSKTSQFKVLSYLAIKYGITLGSNSSPFSYLASDGTTTSWTGSSTYQNNIAGIGRDDNTGLNQKQSKSSNLPANSIVTMALGGIATSNGANLNAFTADKTFEVWGDNGATVLGNYVDLPAGIQQKSQRIWKLKETRNVGTVVVAFDLSGTVLASYGIDYANIRLLVSNNGVFATGATVTSPITFNNIANTIQFNYNFSDGDYFTLGTVNNVVSPLPLNSISLAVSQIGSSIELDWDIMSPNGIQNFEIEWLSASNSWKSKSKVSSILESDNLNHYRFIDDSPSVGTNYYRVKAIGKDSSFIYSEIKGIDLHLSSMIKISPVPADEVLNVTNITDGMVSYSISNAKGEELGKGGIEAGSTTKVNVNSWQNGVYFIRSQDSVEDSYVLKFVVVR